MFILPLRSAHWTSKFHGDSFSSLCSFFHLQKVLDICYVADTVADTGEQGGHADEVDSQQQAL